MKNFIVVQDNDKKFHVWSKFEYDKYIRDAVSVGAGSAYKVVIDFDGNESLLDEKTSNDNLYRFVKASDEEAEIKEKNCFRTKDGDEWYYWSGYYLGDNKYEREYPKDRLRIQPTEIEWLEKVEADQQELWKDVMKIVFPVRPIRGLNTNNAWGELQSKYTLIPKQ